MSGSCRSVPDESLGGHKFSMGNTVTAHKATIKAIWLTTVRSVLRANNDKPTYRAYHPCPAITH